MDENDDYNVWCCGGYELPAHVQQSQRINNISGSFLSEEALQVDAERLHHCGREEGVRPYILGHQINRDS